MSAMLPATGTSVRKRVVKPNLNEGLVAQAKTYTGNFFSGPCQAADGLTRHTYRMMCMAQRTQSNDGGNQMQEAFMLAEKRPWQRQVRAGGFYPCALERGSRFEQAM